MKTSKKFIVITSIFPPTEAVKKFANIKDWHLIVVGDHKTPKDWSLPGVTYLSPEDQQKLGFSVTKNLPWNHYCRKLVGYLYAMKEGAELIADSDDDNLPHDNWPKAADETPLKTLSDVKFVNIYKYFTDEFVWPRGYPLSAILGEDKPKESNELQKVGIWQFLANGDPDVDAIYRLTNNEPITFDDNEPIVLKEGTVCPFNSQNTIFKKEVFPLLYLPAFVTFRFTDILRGLVAQPILWKFDYKLGFGPATVFQERNPHNYLKDFESEIPVYLNSERVVDIAAETLAKFKGKSITQSLVRVYGALEENGIVTTQENALAEAWANDVKTLTNSS